MYHPLSRQKPLCLDSALTSARSIISSRLKPGNEIKLSDATSEDRQNPTACENLKGTAGGDVVLSPQRRSFNTGCFVNASRLQFNPGCIVNTAQTQGENGRSRSLGSPAATNDCRDVIAVEREMTRRIGSGRIISRDSAWDSDSSHSRNRDDRAEKRSSDRHNENYKEKHRNEKGAGYGSKRIEEEPEWFSCGPTSKHDTIELSGFIDLPEEKGSGIKKQNRKLSSLRSSKRCSVQAQQNNSSDENSLKTKKYGQSSSQPASQLQSQPKYQPNRMDIFCSHSDISPLSQKNPEFTLEDFLKSDSFPGILTSTVEEGKGGEGSRFSRWFRQDSDEKQKTDSVLFNNMINDKTSKIHSVEELEACLRKPCYGQNKEEEMTAFKKLVNQVIGCSAKSNKNLNLSQPTGLLEMLNGKQQQPFHTGNSNSLFGGYQQNNSTSTSQSNNIEQPMRIPPDVVMKLLHIQQQQQQQQQLARLLGSSVNSKLRQTGQLGLPSSLSSLQMPTDVNDLWQRPDRRFTGGAAQNTIGLPEMHPYSNKVLQQILLSHHQQHRFKTPPAHSNFPLPHDELAIHTQNLMKSTLLKKKLQEQHQHLRNQQELQRQALHQI